MKTPIPDIDSEINLKPFFSLSRDYLCIAGYDGYFRKVNPAFVKLMGYSMEELFSNPISVLIHPEDRAKTAEHRDHLLKDSPLLNFENRYVTKSGDIVWLTWTSIPVPDQKLVYAIAKNITHLKKMEEERQALIKELAAVNSELKQLSYTTSHDLRSPVNNLISLVSFIDVTKIQDEETGLYFELLEKSVHQLKSTLDEQVDQIKDTLSLKTNLEPINLNGVLHSITDSIRSLIEDSKAVFRVDFSEAGQLLANNFSLQSIFLNLISNSIKYARPGIPPEITIVSKKTAEGIQIRFTDNGIGFDMEKNKNKLFGLNQVFSHHSDSKGIGLYLVKNYMNSLGGEIEVTSQLNAGSTFTLTFKN